MDMTLLSRTRRMGAYPNEVVSWGYRLRTGPRCPGIESRRDYKTPELTEAAAARMVDSLRSAEDFSVQVITGERSKKAFHNDVVSWKFQISTGARCPGVTASSSYSSYELAAAAGERMRASLKRVCSS